MVISNQDTLDVVDANIAICRGKKIESSNYGYQNYLKYMTASEELKKLEVLRLGFLVGMGRLSVHNVITQILKDS